MPEIVATPTSKRNLSISQISQSTIFSAQPPLLRLALEKLRHRVFNTMPIRLLAFKSDGSGMELIERSTVFDRIFIAIQSDFTDGHIESELCHHLIVRTPQAENHVVEMFISRHAKYAILSHTWLHDAPGEVTYADWKFGEFDTDSVGYQKLASFCRIAATEYGVTYGWMDTICINKDSSAELDESIRSMYNWYRDASVCITYLAQTLVLRQVRHDPWFTRGWTLQELLAPRSTKFYGADWKRLASDLNDEDQRNRLIQKEIRAATTITQQDLLSFQARRMSAISISRRMKWAANRRVTREEDVAYSLMGIFDVSLSIAYGEGAERAFMRLVKEILNMPGSDCLDLLNWGSGPSENGTFYQSSAISTLLPSSPKQYLWHTDADIDWPSPRIPITLTHLSLRISVLLMPAISEDTTSWNTSFTAIGQFYANADVEIVGLGGGNSNRKFPRSYNLLDAAAASDKLSGWDNTNTRFQIVFGILNFRDADEFVELPRYYPCFAICLYRTTSAVLRKVSTARALEVRIKHVSKDPLASVVQKSKLGKHGMQLVTLYL
ncbi:hypothetical protein BJ912DRAFT_884018 [Pholiota molesta]|nr:hypothetical protein BJ912DRAFT_884018 [Pholiota molesta]